MKEGVWRGEGSVFWHAVNCTGLRSKHVLFKTDKAELSFSYLSLPLLPIKGLPSVDDAHERNQQHDFQ